MRPITNGDFQDSSPAQLVSQMDRRNYPCLITTGYPRHLLHRKAVPQNDNPDEPDGVFGLELHPWRQCIEVLRFELMVERGLSNSHKHQERKRSMKHYAGLDVSVKETTICVVDEAGTICREIKVTSHPDDLIAVLKDPALHISRIGLEAGPLSQWLFEGLAQVGLPPICIETRHTKAFLKAQVNKSDRNDARRIAQMMRVNL